MTFGNLLIEVVSMSIGVGVGLWLMKRVKPKVALIAAVVISKIMADLCVVIAEFISKS